MSPHSNWHLSRLEKYFFSLNHNLVILDFVFNYICENTYLEIISMHTTLKIDGQNLCQPIK